MKEKIILVLSGMAIGICLFTKNEGFIFLIAVSCSQIAFGAAGLKRLYFLMLGVIPFLTLTIFLKVFYAPASALLKRSSPYGILSRITNPARYIEIFKLFVHYTYTFGEFKYNITFILFIFVILFGFWLEKKYATLVLSLFITIGIILVGYYSIYLLTPYDLEWHIATSLQRLYMQIWPTVIFVTFMSINSLEALVRKPKKQTT